MRRGRKLSAFTLIEVMVAFSLMALLIGTLFFWYRSTVTTQNSLKAAQTTLLEERFCDQKLEQFFKNIAAIDEKAETVFFTSQEDQNRVVETSLVFHLNNGPHMHPSLSGVVLARLYVDKASKLLCIGLWPKLGLEPSLTIPLLGQIESCSFSFYYPPKNPALIVDPEQIGKAHLATGWQKDWEKSYQELPLFIKVDLQRPPTPYFPERTLELIYEIPTIQHHIVLKAGVNPV